MEVPVGELTTAKLDTAKPNRIDKDRAERLAQVAMAVISVVLIYFIFSSLYSDLTYIYNYRLSPFLKQYWPNMLAVVALIIVGFNLYIFREYKRLWYGVAEVLLAMALGWYAVNKAFANSLPDAIVIFFAALYLVERGWTNISNKVPRLQIGPRRKDER